MNSSRQGRRRGGTCFVNCERICVASCVVFVDSGENIHHAMLQKRGMTSFGKGKRTGVWPKLLYRCSVSGLAPVPLLESGS